MTQRQDHLDGNAAAGELADVFGRDVSDAAGECRECRRPARIAETRAYLAGPGVVLRCPGCEAVLLRVVRSPTHAWLDVGGLSYLRWSTAP